MASEGPRKAAGAAPPPFPANDDGGRPRHFPETECLRGLLPIQTIAAAQDRSARLGIGADRVLVAGGALSADDYARALAQALGTEFEPLDGLPRALCPLEDQRLIEAAGAGLLPLSLDEALCLVVAPRGTAARRIVALIQGDPSLARRFRFTSDERLTRFILRGAGKALAARATEHLSREWPGLSAAPPARFKKFTAAVAALAAIDIATTIWAPASASFIVTLLLAVLVAAPLGLRLVGAFVTPDEPQPARDMRDAELPVYSVIAALYRESASVDGLLRAIERLDYPREKLDVILAVEADDRETRAAIEARSSRMPITVIAVPAHGPRTKPKALNVALPFARGHFTVIYDAEDRPEPDQLRCALRAFETGGEALSCVQARLCIDNTADSWLARFFTAEYAGQFDVFLPGLARFGLPLPLGGTSNHFRTAILRAVGGWDAHNVTEDADLGMRLARLGHRTRVIASTTYEEAPARLGPWLRQRTRWFKGWMQTWSVHMRQPRRLLRELGLGGFLAFQLIVGGSALAALLHPLFMASLAYSLLAGGPLSGSGDTSPAIPTAALIGTVILGYAASALVGLIGLRRRGIAGSAWVLLLTPVHWLLLSLAAWRALYQLATAPYLWEKTEHGLAKSSRLAARMTRSLIELERYLGRLKQTGKLASVGEGANSATR
ncbi:MAG TPA: glycosyltransferase, partial [Pseudolabrys sp.]|nr:glycosyltransferase [Pseudolabrys sp.]